MNLNRPGINDPDLDQTIRLQRRMNRSAEVSFASSGKSPDVSQLAGLPLSFFEFLQLP